MKAKRSSDGAHKVTSVLIYVALVLVLFVPFALVDPDLMPVGYPPQKGQEFFLFHERFYFEPFIELVFISMASVLFGLILFGAAKIKIRAVVTLTILACIYVPFSFFLYLLPSFFDFLSDLLQAGFRRIICERHHTEIVATTPGYLYDCPLGVYTFVFVLIKNIFVLVNITILSVLTGFIFMLFTCFFQDEEKYIAYNKYLYFCLYVFVGSLPLIGIMLMGQLFDLYAYVLYQILILAAILGSFIPVIIHICNEMNPYGMIPLKIRKTYVIISLLSLTLAAGALISLITIVFGYDAVYLFALHGGVGYRLMFASYYLFFAVMLILMTSSFKDDGFSLADISVVILAAIISGGILVAILSDAFAKYHFVWHAQDRLLSRNAYEACLSGQEDKYCPYVLMYQE